MKILGSATAAKDIPSKAYVDHYGVCNSAASDQAKVVTVGGITALTEGTSIRVRFANAQLFNGIPTLNVNSLGAKQIMDRVNSTSTVAAGQGAWHPGQIVDMVYDGTYWVRVDNDIAGARNNILGATSIQTNTVTDVGTITLAPGTWIIYGYAQFAANSAGFRALYLSRTSESSGSLGYGAISRCAAVSGQPSTLNVMFIATILSQTEIHLLCQQTTGSDLNVNYGIQTVGIE